MSTVAYNLCEYVVCSPEGPEGLINEVVLCSEVITTVVESAHVKETC